MPGTLYLCATPIGNLEDITFRALRVLKEVDLIAAEDTRQTRKLLNHYEIHTGLTSYHEHNAKQKGGYLLELLKQGKDIAIVSDAGTPGISDPGYDLVVKAVEADVRIIPIPGPTAAIAALTVSGIDTGRFAFEGFLPRGKQEKLRYLKKLQNENRTLIFYEAPHRLAATLEALAVVFPQRKMAVSREITKKFEETVRGQAAELLSFFREKTPRGEFTIILQGAGEQKKEHTVTEIQDPVELVRHLEEQGSEHKEAIKETARLLGLPKREVYGAVIRAKKLNENSGARSQEPE